MSSSLRVLAACWLIASAAAGAQTDEWPTYGRDPGGSRFAPHRQINTENVSRLTVAWRFNTGELEPGGRSFEATPILVDGTLFLVTPLGRVFALDPVTGSERWRFEAKVSPRAGFGDFTSRGVSTWLDSSASVGTVCRRRIIVATVDARLLALDAASGRPCTGFGRSGTVSLRAGLRNRPFEVAEYEVTSPPAIVNGTIIVGSAIADNNRVEAASGEVRGYDARTGALKWTWDPVPQHRNDPAYASWRGDRAHRTGAANAWSVIAADPARDMVVVPTSSPSPDYFGGRRLGRNDYANSVVALRASTGEVLWHFQTVHHDLWDYDNASPPALVDLTIEGRSVPAVLQATKTGMLFVLHRETGEPLVPVEERPVPASDVAGEEAWPTQPFSTLPPLSPHRLDATMAFGLNDSARRACAERIAALRNEGIFTPPSLRGTLAFPSNIGGAHWGGVAWDATRGWAIVPVNTIAAFIQLIPADGTDFDSLRRAASARGEQVNRLRETPFLQVRGLLLGGDRVPCSPPPFGELVAVDIAARRIAWRVPLGDATGFNPDLKDGLGSPNLGGAIVTAGGVAFIAATLDSKLRAFDVATGRELWSADLPAGGKATPMTYVGADGRQYVLISAGGDGGSFGRGDAVMAFVLPR
ncbi:MAG: pyrroloquinoline quinone-dependent dehydrogenase [Gemmatimonadaceae bacterium]|nr:pyrroloquinoline quinone-dependent dehydrogenase [Gemmatimonadaceae bacterium]MCW5825621.1 pyrroloquinoline quinone-dependent dehydrogenase [Gemmatimonadaceae bacterium]